MANKLEYFDRNASDTLTGEPTYRGVYVESGARRIYIGINTICHMVDILKANGAVVQCPLTIKTGDKIDG